MKVELPCGQVEILDEDSLPQELEPSQAIHALIEQVCLWTCPYRQTCGSFHDWFTKHHVEVT